MQERVTPDGDEQPVFTAENTIWKVAFPALLTTAYAAKGPTRKKIHFHIKN